MGQAIVIANTIIRKAGQAIFVKIPFGIMVDRSQIYAVSVGRLAKAPISNKLIGVNLWKRRKDSFSRFSSLLGGVK